MRIHAVGTLLKCRFWSLLTILTAVFFAAQTHASERQCSAPLKQITLTRGQAIKTLAKEKGYTEGLIFSGGFLYESQGLYGKSLLKRIDPYTGMAETVHALDTRFFAEGLAEVDHRFFQMTYKENTVFTYTAGERVQPEQAMTKPGEAWGLTQLDGQLVMSDGSSYLRFLDPATLQTKRKIQVRRDGKDYSFLNELESAHGLILANIFGADWVAMINPQTGCIEGALDLSALRASDLEDVNEAKCAAATCVKEDFAANGIAFDAKKDELYFTGKNWPYIFVFKYPQ